MDLLLESAALVLPALEASWSFSLLVRILGMATAGSLIIAMILGLSATHGLEAFRFHKYFGGLTTTLALLHGGAILLFCGWGSTWRQGLVTILGFGGILSILTAVSFGIRLSQGELVRGSHRFFVQLAALILVCHIVAAWLLAV